MGLIDHITRNFYSLLLLTIITACFATLMFSGVEMTRSDGTIKEFSMAVFILNVLCLLIGCYLAYKLFGHIKIDNLFMKDDDDIMLEEDIEQLSSAPQYITKQPIIKQGVFDKSKFSGIDEKGEQVDLKNFSTYNKKSMNRSEKTFNVGIERDEDAETYVRGATKYITTVA